MKFFTDFHIHSKYSRATSRDMDLEHLDKWAQIKGVKVLGTGDFTHPVWLTSLKDELEPAEQGLYKIKSKNSDRRFILTSEISCIYSKKNRVRKIHILVLAPSFEVVDQINAKLNLIGNLKSDGRPILGLDAKELAKIVLNTSEDCLIVPCHCLTPWFAIFGSKSGFDSIEECFEDFSKYIYAMETGLSADPKMLWRMPDGRKITLISNSDAHSPQKIGREANCFDTDISYFAITEAIKSKDPKKFLFTIEFFPEEGKYHFDGHRACEIRFSPKETKKYHGICPVCAKPLTVGVLSRIEILADKPEGFIPANAIPFYSLVPLEEVIADSLGKNTGTKEVVKEYNNLIEKAGSEFDILLNIPREELEKMSLPQIVDGIIKIREGKVFKDPGYDGVYGKIGTAPSEEKKMITRQNTLF
ncbi:MAG: endonuclease Q family protein [bacterium]|nr:endonuclease Q family protein [bacterium]